MGYWEELWSLTVGSLLLQITRQIGLPFDSSRRDKAIGGSPEVFGPLKGELGSNLRGSFQANPGFSRK